MNFHILTLFPDMVMQGLSTSIIGRAKDRGLLSIEAVNIRDYTLERHKKVDDYISALTNNGLQKTLFSAQIPDFVKASPKSNIVG